MIVIAKKKNETKDRLFRRFTRLFREENILFEVRRRMFYKKPSLIKKEKQKERAKAKSRKRRF